MKYMNQTWLEPGIGIRLAVQMTQLDFLAPALGRHPCLWAQRALGEAKQLPA